MKTTAWGTDGLSFCLLEPPRTSKREPGEASPWPWDTRISIFKTLMDYDARSSVWKTGIVPEYLFFEELELTITGR